MVDPAAIAVFGIVLLLVLLVLLWRCLTTIAPDEQGVVILLGAYKGLLNPGFNVVSPLARVIRVKMSTQTFSLGNWSVPLAPGPVPLTGTLSFRVTNPAKATFQVAKLADELVAQTRAAVATSLSGPAARLGGSLTVELSAAARSQLEAALDKVGVRVESVLVQRAPG